MSTVTNTTEVVNVSVTAKDARTFLTAEMIASQKNIATVASTVSKARFGESVSPANNGAFLRAAFAINERDSGITVESLTAATADRSLAVIKTMTTKLKKANAKARLAANIAKMAASAK